jgi:hypothetical protein
VAFEVAARSRPRRRGAPAEGPEPVAVPRSNPPRQLTSFVGREHELARVRRLLGSTRLLTLIDAGGAGKTRLALQAASTLLGAYSAGVHLVATLANALPSQQLLLVLDDCEHLVQACPELRILVTSRQPLPAAGRRLGEFRRCRCQDLRMDGLLTRRRARKTGSYS